MIGTELNRRTAFGGFAQSNELVIQLSYGANNPFIQRSFGVARVSDSKNHQAQWAGDDGTRTLVWNLQAFTFDDGSGVKTVSQIITDNFAIITDAKIGFVTQIGGGTAPGSMYFDNV